ncbi:hypothetical protein V6N12_063431 [Hibiscus sabdariffa]|uniref:Uncharacterized protein n=1 Tax=Hibiscus sabdariffa TaxID=183260 RepID=A0ABR2FBR1_9ROSI
MKLGETEELRDTSIPKPLLPDYQRLLSSLPSRSAFVQFVLIVVQGLSGMVRQAKKLVSQGSWQCLSGKCCCNADLGPEATCF